VTTLKAHIGGSLVGLVLSRLIFADFVDLRQHNFMGTDLLLVDFDDG
jgi:hypothetical protein